MLNFKTSIRTRARRGIAGLVAQCNAAVTFAAPRGGAEVSNLPRLRPRPPAHRPLPFRPLTLPPHPLAPPDTSSLVVSPRLCQTRPRAGAQRWRRAAARRSLTPPPRRRRGRRLCSRRRRLSPFCATDDGNAGHAIRPWSAWSPPKAPWKAPPLFHPAPGTASRWSGRRRHRPPRGLRGGSPGGASSSPSRWAGGCRRAPSRRPCRDAA